MGAMAYSVSGLRGSRLTGSPYRIRGLQCKVLLGPVAARGHWLTGLVAFGGPMAYRVLGVED